MAKQLNVNLAFTADTSAAKRNMQELQTMLKNLTQITGSDLKINESIESAVRSAAELKTHLESATNVKTGNLDFTKLNDSLKKSGKNLGDYGEQLMKLGPDGQKAFHALASSVAQAEIPIKRSNAALTEMWTTLKNTARWQLSSSILHGFMGAIQSAYGYAQDLNESLNNIRIVTGQSTEEMAKFAEMANRTAKSLSASTTDYTNAALIYYQQGLDDNQVKERTDITVKMANVARQSSEVVSDQMTAIWNNFYDGSKSLEYYADVMTALGAATASSTDEIAGGLEKFAAVADTIGLSYEYAASALATITSNTRQSEEVVGTALKTIFARIQGLNLGETLEDGTTLNKYSEALQKVGISIYDSTGELKKMDSILEEMGSKWDSLSKNQQVALAQTVAGVRQYNQLVSLMDNWDSGDSDSMMANLNTARGSSGALQEQADIYAESWEAAQKRVEASLEAIYANLINDEAFIGILDGISDVLDGFNSLIDAVGGLNGVLGILGGVLGKIFHKQLAQSVTDFGYSIAMTTEKGREKVRQEKKNEIHGMIETARGGEYTTREDSARAQALEEELLLQSQLIDNSDKMSESELKINQILLDRVKILNDQKVAAAKKLQEAEDKKGEATYQAKVEMTQHAMSQGKGNDTAYLKEQERKFNTLKQKLSAAIKIQVDTKGLNKLEKDSEKAKEKIENIKIALRNFDSENATGLENFFDQAIADGQALEDVCAQLDVRMDAIISKTTGDMFSLGIENNTISQLESGIQETEEALEVFNNKSAESKEAIDGLGQSFENTKKVSATWADGIVAYGTAITSVVGIVNTFKSTIDTLKDPDASGWEKFSAILLAVGSAIGLVTMAFNKESVAAMASTVASVASALGFTGVASSATAAAAGTVAFGTALWTVLWPIGLVMAAIAALVGIIAGLVYILNQPTDAEKNLEKATEASEKAKKSFEETKSAAQDLKDAFSQYDSVYKTFQECTVGTQEWKDAMLALNTEVDNLIKKYPELKKFLEIDKTTGALTISEEGLEQVQAESNNRVTASMINSAMADVELAKAKESVSKESFENTLTTRGVHYGSYLYEAISDAVSAGLVKGTTASSETDMAAILAEMKNNLEYNAHQEISRMGYEEGTQEYNDYVNKILSSTGFFDEAGKAWIEGSEEWLDSWGWQQELIAAALSDDQISASIRTYVEAITDAGTEMDVAIATLAANLFSDRTDLSEAEKQQAVKYVEDDVERRKQELINTENANHDYSMKSDALAVETWNRYLAASGKNWELQENAIQRTDANREYAYIDENGDKQTISFEDMASTIAAYEALNAVGDAANQAAADLMALGELPKDLEDGFKDYMVSGNFNNLSEKSMSEMQGALDIDDNGDASKDSVDQYLMDILKVDSVEKLAAILGESYYEDFNTAQKIYADALADFSNSIPVEVKTAFESIDTSELGLGGKQSILDMLTTAMIEGGSAARDRVVNMLSDLPQDQLDTFSEALANIDWQNATVDDVASALNRAGLSADELGISLYELVDCMQGVENQTLESVQKTYKTLNDIVKDLKTGDTIEQADYDSLVTEFGSTIVDDYFSVMADGTYQLIGDAEKFYELVKSQSQGKFLENIQSGMQISSTFNNTSASEMNGDLTSSTPEAASASIAYLQTLELTESELLSLAAAQEEYANTGTYSTETLASLDALMKNHIITEEQFKNLLEQNNQSIRENSEALLSSATSFAELNSLVSQVTSVTGGEIYGYSEALIKLGSQYENCAEEIKEFQAALQSSNSDLISIKEHELESTIRIAEMAEEYDIAAEEVETIADAFLELAAGEEAAYDILEEDAEALADASIRYKRLNDAVLDLATNYNDYKDVLEELSEASDELDRAQLMNSKSAQNLRKSLSGLLGTSEDLIDANLLSAIDPEDFAEAAEGNEAAIERIRDAFIELQATANNIDVTGLKEELASLEEGIVVDITLDEMPFLYALIEAQLAAGATAADIQNLLSGFNIDATVTDFEGTLDEAVAASASASKQIIANNSYSQDVKTTTVDTPVVSEEVAYSTTYTPHQVASTNYILKNGADEPVPVTEYRTSWTKTVTPEVTTTETTDQEVAKEVTTSNAAGDTAPVKGVSIENAHKSSGGKVGGSTKQAAQTAKNNSGGGGGGGGSKTKPTSESRKKKSDVVDRYKEVEDKLDDVRDAMDDASKSADRLWGASRVRQLQRVNKEIQNEIALLKQQKREAISYLSIDKTDLISKGGALGALFEFDSSGNIANYEEAMSRVYAAREAMLDSFGAEMDEAEEERLKDFDERLEKLKDAIAQYDETRELIEDLDNSIDDQFNAWQDNNYEILNHTLEVNIEINDKELEILDYYLSKMEDDFYNMAEAGALMLGNLSGQNIGKGGQLGVYVEGLQEYEDHLERLKQSYKNGEISQAAYIEGLQEVQDGLLENLESIQELDKTMMEYYGDTIAAAGEELAKFTDQMEHQSSVLEHYKAILELTGKETDYEAIGIVLEGQAKAAENRVKVNKETADMYREQADARYAEYQKALAQGNEQAAELYKKQYEAALQAANEAEEEYLSSVEEWAESVKAVLENTMADLSRTLENALTGGTSFDQMSIALERAASLQEEYLTSTNQIYETNKLMRSAQQEIDKMTNSVAKRRLQAFISETKELQNQKELSQYELEIQQAKYDLLLAQIALEEAQQSKSTVRLQRDSEGNFGYVYTADSSQIADAQQKLEDAQNSLYNIGLEGANSYAEKYQQTLGEMYDTLTDLQNQYLEGAFESEEEYHKAVDAAKHYYYDKLTQYSNLYTIALTTDSRVAADAWSSDFQDMIYSTDEWRSAVDTYINDIQGAFQTYGYEMERIANETIGTSLDTIKDKTGEVVDASNKLVSTITDDGGVIDALTSEMNAVTNLTGEYANLRNTLQGLLSDYEKLLKGINDTTEAEKDKPDAGEDKPKEPSNPSSPSKPSTPAPSTPSDDGERNYDSTTKQGVALAIWNGNYGWGNGTARKQRLEEKGFNYREIQGIVDRTNPNGNWRSRYGISDLSKYAYSSFDTGGYTGNWEGQYGKLALLHQKELILNAGDTENFLASMEVLERILKVIDLQSASAQIGGLLSSPGFIGSGSQVVEQSVTIEASFPGVQDRNEIEEAFNNLINRASQYANRK